MSDLCEQVAGIGEEEEDAGLEEAEVPDPGELGDQGCGDPHGGANGQAAQEDGEEVEDSPEEGANLEGVRFSVNNESSVVLKSSTENDGDGVVKQALAQHQAVHQGVDVEVLKDSKDGHWVGCRDDGAKVEGVEEVYVEAADTLDDQPHDAGDDEGRDDGAKEGKGEDAAEIVKELFLSHAVASVEDDGRQDDEEEELGVKRDFLLNVCESRAFVIVQADEPIAKELEEDKLKQVCLSNIST